MALWQGTVGAAMPYLCLGEGPPMVLLPGLTAHHQPPRGMDRFSQVQLMKPFAAGRRVWWVNRRPGLAADCTMVDIARDYAAALPDLFDEPVDVLGVSTGGSVALQLAADHPGVVKRLVVVASAYRLGDGGRAAQRRVAEDVRAGRPRRVAAELLGMSAGSAGANRALSAVGWLLGKAVAGEGDPDMLATIAAEDVFDLGDRLGEIAAPALVVGGDRDAFYGRRLFAETAERMRDGRLVLYAGAGHVGTVMNGRRLAGDVLGFLA